MASISKGSKSLRKQDLLGQKSTPTALKTLAFAHEFTSAGETSLEISALNAPASLISTGFVQPSVAEIQAAKIRNFRDSLRIVSSDKGILQDYLDYQVRSNNTIEFTADSVANEILTITVNPLNKSGTLVADVEKIVETGTIPAGTTSINIGKSFKVNQNPNFQIGAVALEVEGQKFLRNAGNSTAAPGNPDGDYEEVDSGNGNSVQIELNDSEAFDRTYVVTNTSYAVIAPDGSISDEMERLTGIVNKLVDTTAALAGVPTTDFDAAPTQTQLTAYGQRLVDVENNKAEKVTTTTTASSTGHNPVASNIGFTFTNIDGLVTMEMEGFTVGGTSGSGYITFSGVVPVELRPSSDRYFSVATLEGNAHKIGAVRVNSGGEVRFGAVSIADTFSGATANGIPGGCALIWHI